MNDKELIEEACALLFFDSDFGYENSQEGDLIFRMMEALEAKASERTAIPDAGEPLTDDLAKLHGILEQFRGREIKYKAERDAALAAIERVRALHKLGWQQEPYGNGPDGQVLEHAVSWCLHCDMASPCDTLAALDVAPEPEWEEHINYGAERTDGSVAYEPRGRNYATHQQVARFGPWLPVPEEKP